MVKLQDIVDRIKSMEGTHYVFPLKDECREKILDIERNITATAGIRVSNVGVEECLKRQYVICIIKDKRFRPPPEPTIRLISDDIILGEEVLPHAKEEFLANVKESILWLSEEFVMYPERYGGGKECFLMPPVAFPEVGEYDGATNIVSCSPAPPSDMYIRETHGYEDDPKLATILVGFDFPNLEN